VIAGFLSHRGGPLDRGLAHGQAFAPAVRHNVQGILRATASLREASLARASRSAFSEARIAELEGIAEGAGLAVQHVVAAELLRPLIAPDECTVMMAVGTAAAAGHTVFMKNSDKIGADSLVGDRFHRFKEINVVVDLVGDAGRRIVGVVAAGSTGLKMGVSDTGVAAGSNIARTTELRERRVNVTQLRAQDRGQILRDGLEHATAEDAARWAAGAMIENPTDTPGNVEFAGPDVAFVVEGSYRSWNVVEVRDTVAARTNMFVEMGRLNDPEDRSSRARYERCLALLEQVAGEAGPEQFRAFSQDHANGPGLDSICRHSRDHRDETSLSAMVVQLDPDPARIRVDIALGKPCWAWNDPGGVVTLSMADPPDVIPEAFRSGEAWRRLYTEDPRVG
jgi:hypothetical protein